MTTRLMESPTRPAPTWDQELELCAQGCALVAGVDEAGRGAWAGPLVAGAVVFPPAYAHTPPEDLASELAQLRDSKLLEAPVRERLLCAIEGAALAIGVGIVSPGLIDVIGLGAANRLAMCRAVRELGARPDMVLVDAFKLPSLSIPQRPIIQGDAKCMSIAAASIVAKVTRDHMMQELDVVYPGYGFAQHKGYGTRHHQEALARLGVSPIHRRSYAPIQAVLSGEPLPLAHTEMNGRAP